jgi:hypothetical protein
MTTRVPKMVLLNIHIQSKDVSYIKHLTKAYIFSLFLWE